MPGFELIDDQERRAVDEVFARGGILFRMGFDDLRAKVFKVREFELAFARKFGAGYAQAVTSGTAALKVALTAIGIKPGDEVVTQSFTFVATVEAILECGAIPVVTEIDRTLNMDPDDLARKITPRTRVIVPVHMLGAAARMDKILRIAGDRGVPVVEDTAQACGGQFRGKPLGTLGVAGTFSFDFGKAMTTGEGGMVVTDQEALFLRTRAYSDHGHESNPNFPRGEDTRSMPGFNYRMMELQGAVGLVQLRKLDEALKRQQENKARIKDALRGIRTISFREFADEAGETGDTLVFFLENPEVASRAAKRLFERGIRFKILPEAMKWHFAGTWDHIFSAVKGYRRKDPGKLWRRSEDLLRSAIAIPIFIKMDEEKINRTAEHLVRVLREP